MHYGCHSFLDILFAVYSTLQHNGSYGQKHHGSTEQIAHSIPLIMMLWYIENHEQLCLAVHLERREDGTSRQFNAKTKAAVHLVQRDSRKEQTNSKIICEDSIEEQVSKARRVLLSHFQSGKSVQINCKFVSGRVKQTLVDLSWQKEVVTLIEVVQSLTISFHTRSVNINPSN